MSGLDEQDIFAPECPNCENTREWYLGANHWLLTKKGAKIRGMKYPLIYMGMKKPEIKKLLFRFKCIGCSAYSDITSKMGKKLYAVFLKQQGKFYHKSGFAHGAIGEWIV
jgi:hypothetical protein